MYNLYTTLIWLQPKNWKFYISVSKIGLQIKSWAILLERVYTLYNTFVNQNYIWATSRAKMVAKTKKKIFHVCEYETER